MINAIRFYSVAAYLAADVAIWRLREVFRNRSFKCESLETFRFNYADHIGGMSYRYGHVAEAADRWAHQVLHEA